MQSRILLLSGKQGSGKTRNSAEICRLAIAAGYSPQVIKFADPIYEMHDACLPILKKYGIRPVEMTKEGELLQVIGTEYGRNRVSKTVWLDALLKRVPYVLAMDRSLMIIDDVRFENEMDAFPEALHVRLICKESVRKSRVSYWREDTSHESETALDRYEQLGKFDLRMDTEFAKLEVTSSVIWREWSK